MENSQHGNICGSSSLSILKMSLEKYYINMACGIVLCDIEMLTIFAVSQHSANYQQKCTNQIIVTLMTVQSLAATKITGASYWSVAKLFCVIIQPVSNTHAQV